MPDDAVRRPRYRFPPVIMSHAVWLYYRFSLSFREVEDLLAHRGITVTYETVRHWCQTFGRAYARRLRQRHGRVGDTWHLDELFVTIRGHRQYLWRAVDQDGDSHRTHGHSRPRRPPRAPVGEPALSAESTRKAYELRDRASDREKFFIAAAYDLQVTGNLEKAQQTCELWVQTYPREIVPYGLLGAMVYPTFGKYEKGVEVARKAIEIDPEFPVGYLQLGFNSQFLGDLGEAEKAFQQASDRKLEMPDFFPTRRTFCS